MDESKVIVLAREAWKDHPMYGGVDIPDPGDYDLAALERFAELLNKEKANEIAELYQMCLNQAMTIKKYQDKYGEI